MSFIMPFFSKRTYKFRLPQVLTLGLVLVFSAFFGSDIAHAAVGNVPTSSGEVVNLALNTAIYPIFILFSWLLALGTILLELALKPVFVDAFFNLSVVNEMWKFVRDFANIGFIFILLFSAFATIFQVAQYHIKKIFLSVLLAALFINLSFPIARFIIDATTVPMYFFINRTYSANSGSSQEGIVGASIASSKIEKTLWPDSLAATQVTHAIFSTIVMFLFAVTILVLALQFFIRWVGLMVLLIFSPIGFIGGVFPGLGSFSSKWWDKFISYCLFGPAAALMLLVAVKLMNGFAASQVISTTVTATGNSISGFSNAPYLAQAAFYVLPIALLWMAMGVGSSFGVAGADKIKDSVWKVMKDRRNPFYGTWYNAAKTWNKKRGDARSQAEQRSFGYKLGSKASYLQDSAIAGVAGSRAARGLRSLPGGGVAANILGVDEKTGKYAELRTDEYQKSKMDEAAKLYRVANMNNDQLEAIRDDKGTDKYLKLAVMKKLADDEETNFNLQSADPAVVANAQHNIDAMQQLAKEFGTTSTVFKSVNDKIMKYDPIGALENIFRAEGIDTATKPAAVAERAVIIDGYVGSSAFDAKKLKKDSRTVRDKEFLASVFKKGAADSDTIRDWAKDDTTRVAVTDVLRSKQSLAEMQDVTKDSAKAVQEAYFDLAGGMNMAAFAGANAAAWQKQIFGKLSKDYGANIDGGVLVANREKIAENIKVPNYRDFVLSIKNTAAGRRFNQEMLDPNLAGIGMAQAGQDKVAALQAAYSGDPKINNYV